MTRHLRLVVPDEAPQRDAHDPFVYELLGALTIAVLGGAALGIAVGWGLRKLVGGRS